TGSHWLRMALELYFDRPLLSRHFFEHDDTRPLLTHDHDLECDLEPDGPVIYLHRGPVDVVFSQLTYEHGVDAIDLPSEAIDATTRHYRRHLERWLLDPPKACHKPTTVVYERLRDRPMEALRPAIETLRGEFDADRLRAVWDRVTPALVAQRTEHDQSVIDRADQKERRRERFRDRFGARIMSTILEHEALAKRLDPALLGHAAPEILPQGASA
ncbi:MAG: hypothetical protein AAGK04_11560, partial [Planctomycetota bacterium]